MLNTYQSFSQVWVVYVYLIALTEIKYGFDVIINSSTNQKKGQPHTLHVVIFASNTVIFASNTERVDIDAVEEPKHSHLPFACSLCSSGIPG